MDALIFRRMASEDRPSAFGLLAAFLIDDRYARDSARAYRGAVDDRIEAEAALGKALALFVDRPDYGFLWTAFDGPRAVACAPVGFSISVTAGAVVANLDYVVVAPEYRRHGIGRGLLESLATELKRMEIARIDVSVHLDNAEGRRFYAALGFEPTREERMVRAL